MRHTAPIQKSIINRFESAVNSPVRDQRRKTGDGTGYIGRHERAWHENGMGFERAVVYGIKSLANFAAAHESKYGSPIAEDYVLGEAFADMARGVRAMLNGEIGELDGGFCDAAIFNIWREAGFEEEL